MNNRERDTATTDLLPAPDSDGVYRYPDGSEIVRVNMTWYARHNGMVLREEGSYRTFGTPSAAARALLAIGQGPASLKVESAETLEPFDAEAFILEVMERGRTCWHLKSDAAVVNRFARQFAARLAPHLRK